MAKTQINPEELELEELEDVLASADLDELDDNVEEVDETEETGEEDSENEEKDESDNGGEEEPSEEDVKAVTDALGIGTDSDTAKNGEKQEDEENGTVEEGEDEEDDLLSKLLENPEEVIDSLVEKKLEERLSTMEQQQREMDEKWNRFLEQSEEVSQVFTDFNETMNEGVLEKLAGDPKNAALVLEAENIAEAAYYYAKFGTPIPSAKQLKELLSSEEQPQKEGDEQKDKEAPVPPKGKAVGVGGDDSLVPETLDTADLDF